jgi:CRISPR/Cas system-associated exonuclease Cas4 (RecB family)
MRGILGGMSNFYKPDRNPNWNYGGTSWRLSRSKIDLFMECPRCFYVDNKLGTARPPGFPFNLNSAVDALLKKEFDEHRESKTAHPLMKAYKLDAVPLKDERMDEWRDALRGGITHFHEPTQLKVCGGVDDVWVDPKGELIIVDYKATSKDKTIDALDEDWHDGYKRQMEIYQWLFRQNGFTVSSTGYFVYCNASRTEKAFDGKLIFEVTLIPYEGDDSWVEGALSDIKKTLEGEEIPPAGEECDYCRYREFAGKKLQAHAQENKKSGVPKAKPKKNDEESNQTNIFG